MSPCRYFLPPIIFFAGLSVRKKSFFRNFITIATYGIVGTYISFAIIVCCLLIFKTTVGFLTTRVSLSWVDAWPLWCVCDAGALGVLIVTLLPCARVSLVCNRARGTTTVRPLLVVVSLLWAWPGLGTKFCVAHDFHKIKPVLRLAPWSRNSCAGSALRSCLCSAPAAQGQYTIGPAAKQRAMSLWKLVPPR